MKKLFKVLIFLLLIGMSIALLFIGNGYNIYKEAIESMPLEEKVEEIRSKENYAEFSELPQMYINAVISVEDKRFYKHNGIDIIAICRAAINDIKAMSYVEGGSTITQQIAKNLYFTQAKHFSRKVAEIYVARDIEDIYSKDEILEIYMNTNFYGSGYYGIYDAAVGYYEKEPSELSDYEATLLAGVPNAPSVYSPKVNLSLAEQRQSVVLDKMVESGYISQEKVDEIEAEQVTK